MKISKATSSNTDEKWHAQQSLDQYFPENRMSEDEIAIAQFIINFLKKENIIFEKFLDFGAGPTIHRLTPFVPFVKEIYISEYLEESLAQIQKWINADKDARNWDLYIQKVLELEKGNTSKTEIENRKTELRTKIKKLLIGDIFKTNPLDERITFSLVSSFYCADAVTDSKETWEKIMGNLSNLVSPGGWLILSASRNTNHSILNGIKMHNVKIDENDVQKLLVELGYQPSSIDIKVIPAKMWESVGIESVLVAKAQKKL